MAQRDEDELVVNGGPCAEDDEHGEVNLADLPPEYQWLREQLMNAHLAPDADTDTDWDDPTGGVLSEVLRACEEGETSTLQEHLEELKANLNAPGPDGDTALHLACLYGHMDCVKLLLDHGADANVVNAQDGSTALHDAAAGGYTDICALLLERANASILTAADEDGDTVLHHAARGGYLDICKLLVEKGANPKTRNMADNTPREEADETAVIEYLRELEAH